MLLPIIIIILLLILICSSRKENIQFSNEFMKPYYDQHGIIYHKKKRLLQKGNKFADTSTGFNTKVSIHNSANKNITKEIMVKNGIPTANYYYWNNKINFNKNIDLILISLNFPLVIKPNSKSQGMDVITDINNKNKLIQNLKRILKKNKDIIIEEQQYGDSYRILMMNGEFLDAYKINRPTVIGNGYHSLLQLIKNYNIDAEKPIKMEQINFDIIKKLGYNKNSIIPKGKKIILTNVSNCTIGSTFDIVKFSDIHPDNIKMFNRLSKAVGLNVNGIDFISHNISLPYYIHGSVLETNSMPGIENHHKNNPNSIHKMLGMIHFK